MPADHRASQLDVATASIDGVCVLMVRGVLDGSTYLSLRDTIIKAALDDPAALVIDLTHLLVPADSALAAFTSAHWHISQWSDVPMALACPHRNVRNTIERCGVARYIPVYSLTSVAVQEMSTPHRRIRRRARAELPAVLASVAASRDLLAEWLTAWSQPEFIGVAKLVVTVLVENVLAHTDSEPVVRLEGDGATITVSVDDDSTIQATRHEDPNGSADQVAGLAIVSALTRRWGNAPTPGGKTVWAVIGPENYV